MSVLLTWNGHTVLRWWQSRGYASFTKWNIYS